MAKKAVIVGINAYPASPLQGCVNDASSMFDLLTAQYGFAPDDVRVLVDARATTAAIKERLEWLVAGAQPDDVLVFHFSGHGSQVRDRQGDELADGLDEIICPVDLNWSDKMITDDMLGAYFGRVPQGARCYVVLDCCHSGTGTRDGIVAGNPNPESYRCDRFIAPPFDIAARALGRERQLAVRQVGAMLRARLAKATRPRSFWGWLMEAILRKAPPTQKADVVPGMTHALMAGCKSTQTSADAFIGGRYCGALTYHLLRTVREMPMASMSQVHLYLLADIRKAGFEQEPQLEGPDVLLSKKIFS